jgi:hypothetical protein
MIAGLAMADCESQITDVPDAPYSRSAHLVSEGKLLAAGDLRRMRYCEIRRPVGDIVMVWRG